MGSQEPSEERVQAEFEAIKPKIITQKVTALMTYMQEVLKEAPADERRIRDLIIAYQKGYSAGEHNTLELCMELMQKKLDND